MLVIIPGIGDVSNQCIIGETHTESPGEMCFLDMA